MDQTRGWFYSLLAISTLLFNKAPYKNVLVLGLVQDENGQKMSKSKGNAVDPVEAPVSYTHLDVYKRQGNLCPRGAILVYPAEKSHSAGRKNGLNQFTVFP